MPWRKPYAPRPIICSGTCRSIAGSNQQGYGSSRSTAPTVKVGFLGLGALATAAADRLNQAGFVVCGWSRSPKSIDGIECLHGDEDLQQLLSQLDIVVCLLPLATDTIGLLKADRLAWIKDRALLLNFARGRIVAVPALVAHLGAGRLSHAVLDVFDQEPLPEESRLWDHSDITIPPHISTPIDLQSASRILVDNIRAHRKTHVISRTIDIARDMEHSPPGRWRGLPFAAAYNVQLKCRQSIALAAI